MAISDRMRRKHLAAAQKLVPSARLVGYAVGRSGSNPVAVGLAMAGLFIALVAIMLVAIGDFIVPGVLPVLLLQHLISPPRGIVVADQGIALTKRSVWTGRPHDLVTVMGFEHLQPVEESLGRICLSVGGEHVWVSRGESDALRAAIAQVGFPPDFAK